MAGSQKSIEILHAAAVEVFGVGVTSALEPLSVAGNCASMTVLEDFGELEAADATIKPYFLQSLDEENAIERLPSKYPPPSVTGL